MTKNGSDRLTNNNLVEMGESTARALDHWIEQVETLVEHNPKSELISSDLLSMLERNRQYLVDDAESRLRKLTIEISEILNQ